MKVVQVSKSGPVFTETDLPRETLEGWSVQLFQARDGYSVRIVTPASGWWLLENVKRLTTVNNHLAPYGVRFEAVD